MMTRDEHYTDGRRWSHISKAWILLSSWNAREELATMTAAAESVRLENVRQRALIEQQAKEIAFLGKRVEALRRFLSEKIAESQNQAKEIARLRDQGKKFADTFLDRMNKFGQWEDGCFYYNRTCASELQEVIDMAKTLKEEHP